MAMFNHELHSNVLCVHVRHFLLETMVSHDGRCEDHGQVLWRHLHESRQLLFLAGTLLGQAERDLPNYPALGRLLAKDGT